MLRKLFSYTAIALLSVAAPALAQVSGGAPYGQAPGGASSSQVPGEGSYSQVPGEGSYSQVPGNGPYSRSPAHESEVQRGAPIVDALNLLEAQGYASFSNVQDMGDGKFAADAVKDGQAQHVIIDPATRQISAAGPAQNAPQTMTGGAR